MMALLLQHNSNHQVAGNPNNKKWVIPTKPSSKLVQPKPLASNMECFQHFVGHYYVSVTYSHSIYQIYKRCYKFKRLVQVRW